MPVKFCCPRGVVLCLVLLYLLPAAAQVTVSLSGHVTSPTGAPITGAEVVARNVRTGLNLNIKTDPAGHYQFTAPVGTYEIRVTKTGFGLQVRSDIVLAAGQDATVDIEMQRSGPDACASGHEFLTTDCTLTWHGITLYGAYDIGLGYVTHGLPVSGYNYEGESLVNRNGYQHRWLPARE